MLAIQPLLFSALLVSAHSSDTGGDKIDCLIACQEKEEERVNDAVETRDERYKKWWFPDALATALCGAEVVAAKKDREACEQAC